MKKNFALAMSLIVPALVLSSCGDNTPREELTVLTYNIRNCRGMDEVTDFSRVVDVIEALSPDVIALQEIDSATVRLDGRDVLSELAAMTGMHAVYGPAIDFQGGKYGVGVLSKEKPVSHSSIPLPGREERRTLLMVEYGNYMFFCTHLSLTEEDRIESLGIIRRQAASCSKPVLLAGDFNAVTGSRVIDGFSETFTIVSDKDLYTIPVGNPDRCIDFIMYCGNRPVEVIGNGVDQQTIASDHCPVWATVRF